MGTTRDRRFRDRSPASVADQQGDSRKYFKTLRRWSHATWKWLNGVPVRSRDGLEGGKPSRQRRKTDEDRQARSRVTTVQSQISTNKPPSDSLPNIIIGESASQDHPLAKNYSADSKQIAADDENQLAEVDRLPLRVIQIPPEPSFFVSVDHRGDDISSTTVTNEVLTAKYTVINFLPKNILEQLRRVANIYFVAIILLQCIPAVSNYNPFLAAMPVVVIMGVTAIKDAVEDWKRHHQDNQVNYSSCWSLHRAQSDNMPIMVRDTRWRRITNFFWSIRDWIMLNSLRLYSQWKGQKFVLEGQFRKLKSVPNETTAWQETFWRDLRIGDIVLLRNNEPIPADMVLLSSSEADGVCFVETKNLDGETNLKLKRAPMETSWIQTAQEASNLRATIEVELPHANLYAFQGKIILALKEVDELDMVEKQLDYNNQGTSPDKALSTSEDLKNGSTTTLGFVEPSVVPVSQDELLLRGCVLRNTAWAIGIAIYTGPDTKLMMNAGLTPSKRTRIDRQLNPQIILIFGLLFVICISCAIVQTQFSASSSASKAPYWISSFHLILFQTLVPISMYVTLEMVKTVQAFFISNDVKIYHPETDRRAVPRAWNLADDLGQIQYLFSDKTGTLTQNVMELRKCTIGGKSYGTLPSSVTPEQWVALEETTIKLLCSRLGYPYVPPTNFTFVDPELLHDWHCEKDKEYLSLFFLSLVVCHTVLIDTTLLEEVAAEAEAEMDDVAKEKSKLYIEPHLFLYKAQSPDEAALVSASRDLGFVFLGRDQSYIYVCILGEFEVLSVLNVLEFTSDRKRMSVIVRRRGGQILLLCKGADNIIMERLDAESSKGAVTQNTQNHLERYAEEGLRTLCIAYRQLDESQYEEWNNRFAKACSEMNDRDIQVSALADEIETNLTMLGATAIEDRLQDGVPRCIKVLQQVGIKIWVLTGDKMETAINIGFSCQLLNKRMILLVIKGADSDETFRQLSTAYERIWSRHFNFGEASTTIIDEHAQFALIIEGSTLKFALEPPCRKLFLKLSTKCASVICCRVSPIQKASVVTLVKKGRNAMTMAIGDGANDVGMIQAADVGVGISGQEGMQAVMSSDYAIAQFRFLERLLLIHGRWAYIRVAEVILCSLYKNLAFVVLLFWYQIYCGFTAQYIYDYMYLLFFNVFFSILPLMMLGFLERDLPAERLLSVPQIYQLGARQHSYSMKLFGLYMIDGLYQSIICFFVPMLAYQDTAVTWAGYPESQTILGNVMAFSIIISTNLYMALNTLSWVLYSYVGFGLTITAVICFALVYSFIPSEAMFGSWRGFIDPIFWGTLILSIVLALAPRYLAKYIQATFRPTSLDIVREVDKFGYREEELQRLCGPRETNMAILGANASEIEGLIKAPPKAATREYRKKSLSREISIDTPSTLLSPLALSTTTLSLPAIIERRPNLLQRSLALFNLRTDRFERLRGFAFSQDDGMGQVVKHRSTGIVPEEAGLSGSSWVGSPPGDSMSLQRPQAAASRHALPPLRYSQYYSTRRQSSP